MAESSASELNAKSPPQSLWDVWDVNPLGLSRVPDARKVSTTPEVTDRSQFPERNVYRSDSLTAVTQTESSADKSIFDRDEFVQPAEDKDVPAPMSKAARSQRKFSIPSSHNLLIGLAVVLVLLGLYASINTLLTNHHAAQAINQLSKKSGNSSTQSAPSSVKPSASAVAAYSVAPDAPKYIDVPKLDVHARIRALGMRKDGTLAAPGNVFDAGWYDQSAKPGQNGAMLIDGHISSWTTKGIFYGLDKLTVGDLLSVTRGDGQVFNFQVTKTHVYDAGSVDMSSLLVSQNTNKPGLNLISCAGDVIPGTSEFNKRIVVYAVQQ